MFDWKRTCLFVWEVLKIVGRYRVSIASTNFWVKWWRYVSLDLNYIVPPPITFCIKFRPDKANAGYLVILYFVYKFCCTLVLVFITKILNNKKYELSRLNILVEFLIYLGGLSLLKNNFSCILKLVFLKERNVLQLYPTKLFGIIFEEANAKFSPFHF